MGQNTCTFKHIKERYEYLKHIPKEWIRIFAIYPRERFRVLATHVRRIDPNICTFKYRKERYEFLQQIPKEWIRIFAIYPRKGFRILATHIKRMDQNMQYIQKQGAGYLP